MILPSWQLYLPLLLLLPQLQLVAAVHLPPLLHRSIIKVRATGFLPYESDLVLPLGVLRQLQAQERVSRLLSAAASKTHQQLHYDGKPKLKQQVRLERARTRAKDGTQHYNLIDDDGELLLNLRVHNENTLQQEQQHNNNNNNNKIDEAAEHNKHNNYYQESVPAAMSRWSSTAYDTPWVPSLWRPSSTVTTPRPLPLHQYLSHNSLEQHLPHLPQLRRRLATKVQYA